jgi:hypothetical protein
MSSSRVDNYVKLFENTIGPEALSSESKAIEWLEEAEADDILLDEEFDEVMRILIDNGYVHED